MSLVGVKLKFVFFNFQKKGCYFFSMSVNIERFVKAYIEIKTVNSVCPSCVFFNTEETHLSSELISRTDGTGSD